MRKNICSAIFLTGFICLLVLPSFGEMTGNRCGKAKGYELIERPFAIKGSSVDLTTSLQIAPATGTAGATIELGVTVNNIGDTRGAITYTGYYLSTNDTYESTDVLLDNSWTAALNEGDGVPTSVSATIPASTTPGSYFILFVADHNHMLPESNEANNAASMPIDISGVTSIINPASTVFDFYPNPVTDYIIINLTDKSGSEIKTTLYSDLGIPVMQQSFIGASLSHKILLNDLSKGIYLLQIEAGGRKEIKKIIVQ